MAKISGEQKAVYEKSLFTGPVLMIPIAFNPTKEMLEKATKGEITRKNEIEYEFESNKDGKTSNFNKIDIWCKVNYNLKDDGSVYQSNLVLDDAKHFYVKASIFASKEPDKSPKGSWYVDSNTCNKEWVTTTTSDLEKPRLNYTSKSVHQGKKGEKDLYDFVSAWLNIKEVGIETPYEKLLDGKWKEFNDIVVENLKRTDCPPRGLIGLLTVREGSDGNYQEVYTNKFLPEESTSTKKLIEAIKKYTPPNTVFSDHFCIYTETADDTIVMTTATPNASTW